MKLWAKRILIAAGVGALSLLLGSIALYLAAGGDHVVPATVTQDDSLPAVELNGVRLHHKAVGPEDAPIVVVLHGGPGDDFRALLPLEPLSDKFRVVFYDQRGAGLSERVPSSKLTLDDYIGELDALVEHHGGGPVHLLGHSWGAMLASAYLGKHPKRVKSAILVEPGFLTPEASAVFMAHLSSPQITPALIKHAAWSWFQSLHVSGPDADAAMDFFMLRFMLDAPNDGHPLGVYFCDGDATTAHLPHWRFGSTASAAVQEAVSEAGTVDLPLSAGLEAFEGPVLLVAGACNTLIGPEHQRAYHLPLFKNASLEVVEDAGHTLIGEKPEVALPMFRAFLETAEGPTAPQVP